MLYINEGTDRLFDASEVYCAICTKTSRFFSAVLLNWKKAKKNEKTFKKGIDK